MLEKIDEQLLGKILKASSKTPKEMLFLELGSIPLRLIIRSERMNFFLQYILNQPNESLMKKVFDEQLKNPSRNDWVNLIVQDMKILKIYLSFDEIKILSKNSFKIFLRKKKQKKLHLNIFKY